MLETNTSSAMEALVEAMEQMAFMAPMPADETLLPSPQAYLIRMPFTGPVSGTVEIVAPQEVGTGLAANILATTPDDPQAISYAADALKELLNVTCSLLLPKLGTVKPGGSPFKMTLPQMTAFDSARQWKDFVAVPNTHLLDVEGKLIAIHVKGV